MRRILMNNYDNLFSFFWFSIYRQASETKLAQMAGS